MGEKIAIAIIVVLILGLVCLIGVINGYNSGYENGQVDAINGEIHYHIITNDDNSTSWKWIVE